MAEAHPVGFRWVMKAKERGARVIHVDPRYGRTSQLADLHVPIRAGTDVAFLGGIIRHVIESESYFREYVVHYTNASTLVCDAFRDTEDLEGLFSGFDSAKASYDPASWGYEDCAIGFSPESRNMPRRHSASTPARAWTWGASGTTTRSRIRDACSRSCAVTSVVIRRRWWSESVGSRASSSWRWRMRLSRTRDASARACSATRTVGHSIPRPCR